MDNNKVALITGQDGSSQTSIFTMPTTGLYKNHPGDEQGETY